MTKSLVHINLTLFLFLASAGMSSGMSQIFTHRVDLPREVDEEGINVIYQSPEGYLWLGTNSGLFRWNGSEADLYILPVEFGEQKVTAITGTPGGGICAGLDQGSIFYLSEGKMEKFDPEEGTASVRITGLLIDDLDRLWWATYGEGVYCYTGDRVFNFNTDDGLADNYIYDIVKGYGNEIWTATDRGISLCKLDNREKTIVSYGMDDGLPDLIVKEIERSEKGILWFGFDRNGICSFNPSGDKFKSYFIDSSSIGSVTAMSIEGGKVWIADSKGGLYSVTENSDIQEQVKIIGNRPEGKITGMISGVFGYLWMTDGDELYVSAAGKLNLIKTAGGYSLEGLHSIASDRQGKYWAANDLGLLEVAGDQSKLHLSEIIEAPFKLTGLVIDTGGIIWAATFGKGIIRYDPVRMKARIINSSDGLINDNVLALSLRDSRLWAATLGGASRLTIEKGDVSQIISFNKDNGLSNNYIYDVLEDSKGIVWFATDGNGLIRYENEKFYSYDESMGLRDDVIYSLYEDSSGNIWFSTSKSIIYKYNGEKFTSFGRKEGLFGESIFSITGSGKYILVLTDNGLNILDKENGNIAVLNKELNIDNVISDLNSACLEGKHACFATYQGIIRIDTSSIGIFMKGPKTLINRINVNLREIDPGASGVFSASENQFTFEYSAIWPLAPQKLQYRIKLEGYDNDWQTTYDRSVNYARLQPGDYNFKVYSLVSSPGQPEQVASWSFTIKKPFYAKTWFIVLALIIFLSLIYGVIRIREKRLREKEQRKKEQIEFEFQTLKNQINPHFLFNSFSTLISIIEEKPRNAVEYTEKLSDFFRDILEVKDLELIELKEELRLIKNYHFIQQKRFGEQFRLIIDLKGEIQSTFIPPLTLQLLTENAVKHNMISKASPLTVKIYSANNRIIVENNLQPRTAGRSSTAIGLENIRKRYRITAKKDIIIEHTEHVFKVILPLIWQKN